MRHLGLGDQLEYAKVDVGIREVQSRAVSRQKRYTQEEDSFVRVAFPFLFIGVPSNIR